MLWTATKVAASTGLLVWLFVRFDWTKVLDVVRVIPGIFVIWGLLLVCLGQLLAARRLQILLHAQSVKVSYGLSVRLTFIGLFAGNFLPSTVGGDAAKIILLARKGYGKTVSTLSVATDRLMGLVAFAFLLPTVLATPRIVRLEDIGSAAEVVGVIASIGAAIIVAVVIIAANVASIAGRLGSVLEKRVMQVTATTATTVSRWCDRPRDIFIALGLSIAATLVGIASVWLQADPMGFSVSFIEFVAVYTLVYLATLVPISLNGIGVQEVAFVYLLPHLGATPEQALGLALIARVFYVATSLPGAALIMAREK